MRECATMLIARRARALREEIVDTIRIGDIVELNYDGRFHPPFQRQGRVVDIGNYVPLVEGQAGISAYVGWDDEPRRIVTHSVESLDKVYGKNESDADNLAREIIVGIAQNKLDHNARYVAEAQSYAFGSSPNAPARESLRVLREALRLVKMILTHAHILADGILPECGHSVTASARVGDEWHCTHEDHSSPVMLEITVALILGVA